MSNAFATGNGLIRNINVNKNNETLLSFLRAIKHYKTLLDSEILKDPGDISRLLYAYNEALENLKILYDVEVSKEENLFQI
ncbi:hypothetical protein ACJJI5_21840 [Microbulbifer sp. EKSA008]|uniref:hypothetical protein n=1 Tax=Microbulbifer sp. EKSA008 TaxID=3243367 RepID=UPI0040420C4B